MTPTDYERAVAEKFRTHFPRPHFCVKHNFRMIGTKSESSRQIDIAVFHSGNNSPFLIVEAKKYRRIIGSDIVGGTIMLFKDVGNQEGWVVSTAELSRGARNLIASEGYNHIVITITEAMELRWLSHLEEIFPLASEYREVSAKLVEALRLGSSNAANDVENIGYEEWLAAIEFGRKKFPIQTQRVLKDVARHNYDSGVRYNAFIQLHEMSATTHIFIQELIDHETDSENIELYTEFLIECFIPAPRPESSAPAVSVAAPPGTPHTRRRRGPRR